MGALQRRWWREAAGRTTSRRVIVCGPAQSGMNSTEDGLPVPRRYWTILTLMIGVALSYLDTALVNVALPTIAKDIHSSPADSIWVVNAYQLAVMVSLLP